MVKEVITGTVKAVDRLLRARGFERIAVRERIDDHLVDRWRRRGTGWRMEEIHLWWVRQHTRSIVVKLEISLDLGGGDWLPIDGIPVSMADPVMAEYPLPSGLLFRMSDEKFVARAVRDLEKALDWLEESHGTPQRSLARLASPESNGPGKETDVYQAVRVRLSDLARKGA